MTPPTRIDIDRVVVVAAGAVGPDAGGLADALAAGLRTALAGVPVSAASREWIAAPDASVPATDAGTLGAAVAGAVAGVVRGPGGG